jgi:subtilisin-like proprotein convertase family protein
MRYWFMQVFRASSRLLNAVTGGEGDSTFSAWSYYLAHDHNSAWGRWRVKVVDSLFGQGHCKESYVWHLERDLLHKDPF